MSEQPPKVKRARLKPGDLDPLEYLLSIVEDEANDTATRLEAAKIMAPYLHYKLKKERKG